MEFYKKLITLRYYCLRTQKNIWRIKLQNLLIMRFVYLFIIAIIASNCSTTFSRWDMAGQIVENLDPVSFPDTTFLVADFGAINDGQAPCKQAFDEAITKCSESGGGRIVVQEGVYYMNGPLVFKSNVEVYLEEGAVLSFSSHEQDYLPAVLTRWEGVEVFNYSPLIYAYQVHNIALTGKGTIIGNGSENFSKWVASQKPDKNSLRDMGRQNKPVYERVFGHGYKLRPAFIETFSCTNVRIEGITILDSPFWVIHPVFCDNVIVRDVVIDSHNPNNDGCDPDSSTNILIEGCTFSTGDDAVAIKSGRDNDAWRIGKPTENVVVRNCTFRSLINGVCIGSEVGGGVRNIFIENIKVVESAYAIYFKSNLDRGGYIEDVFIRKIDVERASMALICFESNYKNEQSSFHPTIFRGFHFEDISCRQADDYGLYFSGLEQQPIDDIYLKNITIENAKTEYLLENIENMRFDNVKINDQIIHPLGAYDYKK